MSVESENKLIIDDNKVNHPNHYNTGNYEVIDVIDDWKLNFELGNAVKYIARAGHKDNKIEDLKKAIWYLEREIKNITESENKLIMKSNTVHSIFDAETGKVYYNIVRKPLKNGSNKFKCDKEQIEKLRRK